MTNVITKFNTTDLFANPDLYVNSDVELTRMENSENSEILSRIMAIKSNERYGVAFVSDNTREEYFPEEMETLSQLYYRVYKVHVPLEHKLSWTGEIRRIDDADVIYMTKTLTDIVKKADIPRIFVTPQNTNYNIDDPELIKILDEIFVQTYLPVIANKLVESGFKKVKR